MNYSKSPDFVEKLKTIPPEKTEIWIVGDNNLKLASLLTKLHPTKLIKIVDPSHKIEITQTYDAYVKLNRFITEFWERIGIDLNDKEAKLDFVRTPHLNEENEINGAFQQTMNLVYPELNDLGNEKNKNPLYSKIMHFKVNKNNEIYYKLPITLKNPDNYPRIKQNWEFVNKINVDNQETKFFIFNLVNWNFKGVEFEKLMEWIFYTKLKMMIIEREEQKICIYSIFRFHSLPQYFKTEKQICGEIGNKDWYFIYIS